MRSVTARQMSALRRRNAALTYVWRIIRADGTTYRFTTHDQHVSVAKNALHSPRPGITAYAHRREVGMRPNTTELVGAVDLDGNSIPPGITLEDLEYGRLAGATAVCSLVNWEYPWVLLTYDLWDVKEVDYDRREWRMRMESRLGRLQDQRGVVLARDCLNVVYLNDGVFSFCKADVTGSSVGGTPLRTLTTVLGNLSRSGFTVGSLSRDDGWFSRGKLRVYSGPNAGLEENIETSTDLGGGLHSITLMSPMPAAFTVGDSIEMTAGCNKEWTTCRDKFGQLQTSFRGFKDMKGSDALLKTPSAT